MDGKFFISSIWILLLVSCARPETPVDRKALVGRHIVHVAAIDSLSSLTVGNGHFAFTVDATGLQTYPDRYENGIPLGTYSEWGWHSFPNTEGYAFDEILKEYNFHGRKISYNVQWEENSRRKEAADYLRQNPHRLHLGMIGFDLLHPDGTPVGAEEISDIEQSLNPWNGEIKSSYLVGGVPVEVVTYAHQELDIISVQVQSSLLENGLMRISIRFPYPTGQHTDSGCDWEQPGKHASLIRYQSDSTATISRRIDSSVYSANLLWQGNARISEPDPHHFLIEPEQGTTTFSLSCFFTPEAAISIIPNFSATAINNSIMWEAYWMNGGVVDFTGSTDPRATELERRIVLSQYLTKIQCSGIFPPQETGLTYNSWFGKFHLEMHWWHAAHFALWDRPAFLEKSLSYYSSIAENAWNTAFRQGFNGYRWPKMTDPTGNDSPSGIGPFLIWQQPHIIYLAELCYRSKPDVELIREYAGLVFATADFMASYAWYDRDQKRYILGPALIPAQERFAPEHTINPPFELAYWYFGLNIAQKWRERLELPRKPLWDSILMQLSPLPRQNGVYLAAESALQSYTDQSLLSDHPMVLGVFGMLPESPLIDTATMRKTFDLVWEHWNWDQTWGWDFPMVAMTATRLGKPEQAIEALFMDVPSNTWLTNGHNYQNDRLRLYLPGNGGLLSAVAIMCAGYGKSREKLPGFPKDGTWQVKWEHLNKMP